ncbi:unnamed protein product, partial [Candidula unifasciata]
SSIPPANPFDPEKAADALRKAMKGLGTNEDTVIQILTSHCNAQRLEIERKYRQLYNRDLRADLTSEISGKFLNIALTLLDHPRIFDVSECNEAMKGATTDEDALIEIVSTRSNEEIATICKFFKTTYKRDLERDVHAHTNEDIKPYLSSLLTGAREETLEPDVGLAKKEAQELFKAGEQMLTAEESTFHHMICVRSVPQLRETFSQYKKISGNDIEGAIESELSGNLQTAFLDIIKAIKNPASYFAERLFKSMKGAGTNDRTMVRAIVSRSEVDMAAIKEEFQKAYGKSVAEFIRGDTSGDYRKILVAIVKE